MAVGVPTVSWKFGRPRPKGMKGGRGLKLIAGSILLDAGNSAWMTCGIEKVFRRCHSIDFNVTAPDTSGYQLDWKRSATHKAGTINIKVQQAAPQLSYVIFDQQSGTFLTSASRMSADATHALNRSSIATTTCAIFTAVGI